MLCTTGPCSPPGSLLLPGGPSGGASGLSIQALTPVPGRGMQFRDHRGGRPKKQLETPGASLRSGKTHACLSCPWGKAARQRLKYRQGRMPLPGKAVGRGEAALGSRSLGQADCSRPGVAAHAVWRYSAHPGRGGGRLILGPGELCLAVGSHRYIARPRRFLEGPS